MRQPSTKYPISTATAIIDVTLSLDTSAYAQHDVLAATQVVADAFRGAGTGILQSVTLNDYDANGRAIDLIFLSANTAIGTENDAVTMADNANILGVVKITAANYIDMVNSQFATKSGADCGFGLTGVGSQMWIGAVYRDATGDTYTVGGIRLKLTILQD